MVKKIKRDARINMRLPEELLTWIKGHASTKDTTVTQLFIDYLNRLKEAENGTFKG